jgi:parallel beta-helix repeat protein
MDMVNGGRAGIFADGCRDCTFAGNEIYGFTNDPSVNHYGIIFWKASNRNRVIGNKITGVTNPTQRGLLIDFIGENEAFAGYFAKSGATTRAKVPCSDNIITENVLINGSYGVNLLGCERTIVSNNVCSGQNHRAIYLAEACAWTLITGNELVNFLSTAVLLGYGCVDNVVADNICKREPGVQPAGTGEAVINITTGAQRNAIRNNKIYADTNYGIYLACNVSHNVVADNEVRGYYIAGIAAESDWEASADRPAGAIYSRPNYATPDSVSPTATAWSYANLEGLVIRGNKVLEGAPARSVAGIYVAQVNSNTNLSVIKNSISDNEVFGNADMAHYIYIFEESSGKNVNNKLSGNKFTDVSGLPSASKIFMSRGRLHFNYQLGNDIIDSAVTYFADGDDTPSVAFGGSFAMNNSTATSVTYFDDGIDGLECSVRLSLNTTLVHDNAKLRLKGAVNISGVSGSNFIRIRRESGVWFELYRNF